MSGPYFIDDYGAVWYMGRNNKGGDGCWRFDGVVLDAGGDFKQNWAEVDAIPHHAEEADAGLIARMMHLYELEALRKTNQQPRRD